MRLRVTAEVTRLTEEAAAVTPEKKADADAAIAEATVRKQSADAAVTAAAAALKAATDAATPERYSRHCVIRTGCDQGEVACVKCSVRQMVESESPRRIENNPHGRA
jgi:hypothetical protein